MFLFCSFPDNPSRFSCFLTVECQADKIGISFSALCANSSAFLCLSSRFLPCVHCFVFMAVAANLWAVGASHAGFIALLQSSFLYHVWINLVSLITSRCFAPGVVPAFCSLSSVLFGQLVLVAAPCCCLSPFISVMLSKCGRHWVLCMLRAGTAQTRFRGTALW